MLELTYISRGNKACLLTLITFILIGLGSIFLFLGPDITQETGEKIDDDATFNSTFLGQPTILPNVAPNMQGVTVIPTRTPNLMRPPSTATMSPVRAPTSAPIPRPTVAPPTVSTPFPTRRAPIAARPTTPQPTPQPQTAISGSPIPVTPTYSGLRQYPFAVVYECDWKGNRINLSTKTESHNVVRLCIEAPPLPETEAEVEVSRLNMFIFTRQAYDDIDEALDPLTQHAVLRGKPDPFGLTVLNCPPKTPVCQFATSLRKEFFTDNAFLVGTGELVLQFKETGEAAGMSPITIYFLLSSTDIREPIILGRKVSAGSSPRNQPPEDEPRYESKYEPRDRHQGRLDENESKPLFINKPPT